jgi:hypothetical protein
MKPITYSLQFRGQATPLRSNLLRLRLTAPSSALVTTVGAMGVRGRFNDVSGGEAFLHSELQLDEESSFADRGTIEFGRGNTVRFRSIGGRLTHCPDPHLTHGAAIRQVEGGEGQFAESEGLITSNFFISDTGEVTENHFGVIFVHNRQSTRTVSRSRSSLARPALGAILRL